MEGCRGGGCASGEVELERGESFLSTGFVTTGEDDSEGKGGFVNQALYN